MSYDQTIMFPMSINATPLFRVMYNSSSIWRQQLDLTHQASRRALQHTVSKPVGIERFNRVSGRIVDIKA